MGLPNEVNSALIGAANQGGYLIQQSLRFDGSSYLRRDPGSNGNLRTNTISVWIKQSVEDAPQSLFGQGRCGPRWSVSSRVGEILHNAGVGGTNNFLFSDGRYRDPSAWYHLVIIHDTTQATESDRVRIYVNGTEITFSSASYPGQNADMNFNNTEVLTIGRGNVSDTEVWLGYMAEYQFIDGTAVEPTSFAEYNNAGVWVPKAYAGSYGTQGYYLKFDSTATNGIGHDHSGNGNNFTANGFTTSGIETDVMSDTPTTNYATINPLSESGANITFENGNLRINATSSGDGAADATITIPPSGKFYVEASLINITGGINQFRMGLVNTNDTAYSRPGTNSDSYGFRWNDSNANFAAYDEGTETTYGTADSLKGDVAGILIDRDNGTIKTHQNDVYFNSGSAVITGIPTVEDYLFRISVDGGSAKQVGATLNFGQRDFLMPPGTTSATPYFNTVLWSGNSSNGRAITGVGFQPDFVWIKQRNANIQYEWMDSVRGAGDLALSPHTAGEEGQGTTDLSSFDSDGFTINSGSDVNASGGDYVAWCWKAGGTASSNTDGNITSNVSASTAAGFSVFTYTGNGGTDQTVGHGLGTTPSFCIVKSRGSNSWYIRHNSLPTNKNLNFNSSGSVDPGGGGLIGDLSSSSTITLKSGSNNTDNVNASGTNYVAYCWADKAGVTATGTYTGDGQDGNNLEQTCGFKPAFVMIKGDATASWQIIDNQRGNDVAIFPDSSAGENERSDRKILFTQNGFLVQGNDGNINSGSVNYYWIAFAADFTADSDYKHLNTANLLAPSIKDGSQYFNTSLWTGTGSPVAITGLGFQPDLVWVKARSRTADHKLQDSVRGSFRYLQSNLQNGENTNSANDWFRSFDSDGFTVAQYTTGGTSTSEWAGNGDTYVGWSWLAANGTSSNTDGSITSTVSASASSGFSIVTWTGSQADGTVGHGLNVAPGMIIFKRRNNTTSWPVYHSAIGPSNFVQLNELSASSSSGTSFGSTPTAPTSSVFSVGNNGGTNYGDMVAYCFSEVEGYSKIGYYRGNSSNDGQFVYTGFKPAFILVKGNLGQDWFIADSVRDPYNVSTRWLRPNLVDGEINDPNTGGSSYDILSNGFKWRTNTFGVNRDYDYWYIAFAQHPFGGNGVSPVTAR